MFSSKPFIDSQKLKNWDNELHLELQYKKAKKGELFLKAGQKCNHLYFINDGFTRVYYLDLEGNEITHWFASQDSIITSPFSYVKRETNILFFEALEDTELIMITANQLDQVIRHSPELSESIRHMNAEFAMVLSRRIMSIHTETAEERYLKLMKEHPLLFQKAKLSHIASFLGITQQSLSRIRKKI